LKTEKRETEQKKKTEREGELRERSERTEIGRGRFI